MKVPKPIKKEKTKKRRKKTDRQKAKDRADDAWSGHIHRRDKCCRICGKYERLSAHHVFGRGNWKTRFDPDNGVLLCFYHHNQAHQDNPWFNEWFKINVGEDTFHRLFMEAYRPGKSNHDYDEIIASLEAEGKKAH